MKAVILAGGKGTRLEPVTFETPKPLITVQNRSLMDHAIDLLWEYGVYEIWMSLGHSWAKIKEAYPTLPFLIDVNALGMVSPLGTGGWLNVISNQESVSDRFSEDFIVLNVDNLFDLNILEFKQAHNDNDVLCTIAAVEVDDVSQYGSLEISESKITGFNEKTGTGSGYINSGYYIFSPKIFEYVKDLGLSSHEPVSLEKDVFPKLAMEGKLGVYKSNGQWFDVGTFERWADAIKKWQMEK